MRLTHAALSVLAGVLLASCTPPRAINDSRELLWQQFGHQPVDALLMGWGTPARETRLSDGSRMITYRHATLYETGSRYERSTSCEVSFLAKAPSYRIEDVAMQGDANECYQLSQGHTGERRIDYVEPPQPYYYPHAYRYPYRY